MALSENVEDFGKLISHLVDTAFRAPVRILKGTIKNEEWFKGIVLSAVLLDLLGRWKLQAHFEGNIKPQRFYRIGFEQVIMFLFASKLVDHATYTRMMAVKKMRNDVVHNLLEGVTLDPKQAKTTINKAIKCLRTFGLPG